jgi:hypothetical protein
MTQFPTSRGYLRLAEFHPLPPSRRDGHRSQRRYRLPRCTSRNPVPGRGLCTDHHDRAATDGHGRNRRELLVCTILGTVPIPSQPRWYCRNHLSLCSLIYGTNKSPVLFTVSNLVISDAFPPDVQSLAGGVFNEVSQFGNSVGLAVTAAIAASITDRSALERNEDALMKGYRAAFWTIFTGTVVVVAVSAFGLRHAGTVGKKND